MYYKGVIMNENIQFVHREVLKIFPWIKSRTLISWSERGLIIPEFEEASGRGTRRRYSYQNLIEIGFVSELLNYGIPFSMISNFIEQGEGLSKELRKTGFDTIFVINAVAAIAIDYEDRSIHPGAEFGPSNYSSAFMSLESFAEIGGMHILRLEQSPHLGGVLVAGGKLRVVQPSSIVINFKAIQQLVDAQIKELWR